jgi:hypothetical protein
MRKHRADELIPDEVGMVPVLPGQKEATAWDILKSTHQVSPCWMTAITSHPSSPSSLSCASQARIWDCSRPGGLTQTSLYRHIWPPFRAGSPVYAFLPRRNRDEVRRPRSIATTARLAGGSLGALEKAGDVLREMRPVRLRPRACRDLPRPAAGRRPGPTSVRRRQRSAGGSVPSRPPRSRRRSRQRRGWDPQFGPPALRAGNWWALRTPCPSGASPRHRACGSPAGKVASSRPLPSRPRLAGWLQEESRPVRAVSDRGERERVVRVSADTLSVAGAGSEDL